MGKWITMPEDSTLPIGKETQPRVHVAYILSRFNMHVFV
jgi:hypothetical protein